MFARKINIALAITALATAGGFLLGNEEPAGPPAAQKLRVGTYDSRAVALAYGRSEFFSLPYNQWQNEMEQAKQDNDQNKIERVKENGRRRRNLVHMQVFGNAPIHDLLEEPHLKRVVKQLADAQHLALVARKIDLAYCTTMVEFVDITEALVDSCNPTPKTQKMIEDIQNHPPIPLENFPIDCDHPNHAEQRDEAWCNPFGIVVRKTVITVLATWDWAAPPTADGYSNR